MKDQIRDFLSDRLPARSPVELEDVRQVSVGWSHKTWVFDARYEDGDGAQILPLCLRMDPGNTLLREMSSLETQFRVLTCLEPTAVPTPKPYWYESDASILGGPFLVMEKVQGQCPSPWRREGQEFYAQAHARGVLPGSFARTLATLHTVDWKAAGLEFLGCPQMGTDFPLHEVAKWEALIASTKIDPDPILTDLICWLKQNPPSVERIVLVHGAYRTGNLLIHDDVVSSVLDWELEVLGDPMYDVAYVLSDLNRGDSELLSNVISRDEFFREYERATGFEIDVDVCNYYRGLYAMRSAAFWMSAFDLYESGRSEDLRLARTAWSIPGVLAVAAQHLGF